jgi:hypothetical protein
MLAEGDGFFLEECEVEYHEGFGCRWVPYPVCAPGSCQDPHRGAGLYSGYYGVQKSRLLIPVVLKSG